VSKEKEAPTDTIAASTGAFLVACFNHQKEFLQFDLCFVQVQAMNFLLVAICCF